MSSHIRSRISHVIQALMFDGVAHAAAFTARRTVSEEVDDVVEDTTTAFRHAAADGTADAARAAAPERIYPDPLL